MPQYSELCRILATTFNWHKARLECLARLLMSLMLMSTVNLTQVALGFGGHAQTESRYRRLRRFFAEVEMDFKAVVFGEVMILFDKPLLIYFIH